MVFKNKKSNVILKESIKTDLEALTSVNFQQQCHVENNYSHNKT
jgi:hypothetical protein